MWTVPVSTSAGQPGWSPQPDPKGHLHAADRGIDDFSAWCQDGGPHKKEPIAVSDVWPTIHAERTALADELASLNEEQWRTPSLCSGWSVRDVLAHMTATAKMTPPKFFGKLIAVGFRFDRFFAREIERENDAGSATDVLSEFRRVSSRTSAPPGPRVTWLGETIVHAEDIRRPLGIAPSYPMDALVPVADFSKGSNLLMGAKQRIAGLTLAATDTTWSTGSGPVVSGPMQSLLLALTGRPVTLDELSGDGLNTLRGRLGQSTTPAT